MSMVFDTPQTTTVEKTATEISSETARRLGVPEPVCAITTDPIQSTAKQNAGLGQNAYSNTSRYLPNTPANMKNQHKAAAHFEQYDDVINATADATVYALETIAHENGCTIEEIPPNMVHGVINSMSEKFAWKMVEIENAVETDLLAIDGVEKYDDDKTVVQQEKDDEDIVLEVDGERTTFQVKTGSGGKGNADYLIKVDATYDEREIEYTVKE